MASFIGLTNFLALGDSSRNVFEIAFGILTCLVLISIYFADTMYLGLMLLTSSLVSASD